MPEFARPIAGYLFPLILLVFVAVYMQGLLFAAEPEVALTHATLASVALALLGRWLLNLLETAEQRPPRPNATAKAGFVDRRSEASPSGSVTEQAPNRATAAVAAADSPQHRNEE